MPTLNASLVTLITVAHISICLSVSLPYLSMAARNERVNPKGPCNQNLSTGDLGNSNYSTGFG